MTAEKKKGVERSYELKVYGEDIPWNLGRGQIHHVTLPYMVEIIRNGEPIKLIKMNRVANLSANDKALEEIAQINILENDINKSQGTTFIRYEIMGVIDSRSFTRRRMD